MKSKNEFVKQLKEILNESQILTDFEDLYVYSFEKPFLDQIYPKLDIVVKSSSLEEEQEILELAKRNNIAVIKRGKEYPSQFNKDIILLLDNIKIPNLEACNEEIEDKDKIVKEIFEMHRNLYSTHKNLALAVQNLLFGKTLNKCQQCITCSGYCTVSPSYYGIETWSSKGKMLIARGIMKGELTFSNKAIDTLYACTKCGLCFAQCFQDLEFHEAILYLRRRIAENKLVPQVYYTTAKNISEHGDPSGTSIDRRLLRVKNMSNLVLPDIAENLCFLGCTTATRTPKTAGAVINILTELNLDFTMLGKNEGCCGYILISTGLWEQAKEVANELISKIEETRAKTIITPCSGCYYTFTRLYPEILDLNMPCEILHTSQFLEKMIKEKAIRLKPLNLKVSYHDPCSLGRHSKVYDPPRNVLKAIPNLEMIEMPLNRKFARCCGGGAGFWTFNNKASLETTQIRLKEDLISANVNILTTACPQCQLNFRFASRMNSLTNNLIKIYDITEMVEMAMKSK
ncbi:MAG: (Fe-S)-binding protein [Candidatus Odinarchaeota archaeon]